MFIETKEIGPEGLVVSRSIDGFRLPLSGEEAIWIDTVHLNGEPARSCSTTVSAAAKRQITTIEGIGATKEGKAVQEAWIASDVPQCGYCQSGQIMSAAALLAKVKRPTDAEVEAAMNGNVCRCGTYNRIRAAIRVAARNVK